MYKNNWSWWNKPAIFARRINKVLHFFKKFVLHSTPTFFGILVEGNFQELDARRVGAVMIAPHQSFNLPIQFFSTCFSTITAWFLTKIITFHKKFVFCPVVHCMNEGQRWCKRKRKKENGKQICVSPSQPFIGFLPLCSTSRDNWFFSLPTVFYLLVWRHTISSLICFTSVHLAVK